MSAAEARLPAPPPVPTDKPKQPSLNARVSELETRIDGRRKAIAARASSLLQGAGRKLSSPVTLLLAVGGGVALGYFTRYLLAKAKTRRPSARARDEGPEIVARPSIFATLLDAFTLITTVLSMVPAFAQLLPSFRRAPDGAEDDPR